ncbi:spore germination B3 GerAC family protein [Alkaliphilus metalliredigens QYMF]|uniref:Spore germination B3 GerAC family protein n=1 Tax=Alkaliphilus metalliredigens (strain QYMF) TaxID=293826 RepID=A6TLM9_ALKMQ|nr:Ger(x)C family spore germination protein [Alkaliphilus metalliredigens]ABR47097.1 spore germination B3 GerAC family protein [Alkaliphilus metalliredigens QYMF]
MKKVCKLLLLMLICLLLSSCWDAKQLDDLYLVYGIGVDISKENPERYLVTIVAPTVHPEANEPKIEISSEGTSIRNAQDNIQNKAARRITFANTKIFFIGEEAAKKGIGKHIDSMLRDPEGRGTIKPVVVEGRAVDLMDIDPAGIPIVSLYVSDLLRQSNETSTIPFITLRVFHNALKTDGIEPVIPFIKYGNKPSEFLVNTISLFRQDKMIGKLEGIESFAFIVLTGQVQDGFITLSYPLGDIDEYPVLTLRVKSGKSKIKTEIKDSRLHIYHEISLTTYISEYTSSESVFDEKIIEDMEKAANLHLEAICKKLIKKLQNEYENDNIGYGRYVKVNHPEYFEADDWNEQFAHAVVHVKANVRIQMVGTVQ